MLLFLIVFFRLDEADGFALGLFAMLYLKLSDSRIDSLKL